MQVKAFAIMVLGVVGVLGWLISSPDPTRAEQEQLLRVSAPALEKALVKIIEISEEKSVSRNPSSVPESPTVSAGSPPPTEAEQREIEVLSELVQEPPNSEQDVVDRFNKAKQIYSETHSDFALGTMRELTSMMRTLYEKDPRIISMENDLTEFETRRIHEAHGPK